MEFKEREWPGLLLRWRRERRRDRMALLWAMLRFWRR